MMRNLDHILELMALRWGGIVFLALLSVACALAWRTRHARRVKAFTTVVCLACGLITCVGLRRDYNLILLSGEEDDTAEGAFEYLDSHLSKAQLCRLLSSVPKSNPYLRSKNVRFYLALMGARQGLLATNVAALDRPLFFAGNKYNGFASRLNYPISYEEFIYKYRETRL